MIPKPLNAADAWRQATRFERAQEMDNAGYTLREDEENKGMVYFVQKADLTLYLVLNFGDRMTCTCPDFTKHKDFCKHTIFTDITLKDAQRALDFENEQENAELISTGCDPHTRY